MLEDGAERELRVAAARRDLLFWPFGKRVVSLGIGLGLFGADLVLEVAWTMSGMSELRNELMVTLFR